MSSGGNADETPFYDQSRASDLGLRLLKTLSDERFGTALTAYSVYVSDTL
jgi:hypothetical protein